MLTKHEGVITQKPATLEIASASLQSLHGEEFTLIYEKLEELLAIERINEHQFNEILTVLIYGEIQ